MTFERKTLPEQHYLYVDREASFAGTEIADAMASGFGAVFGYVEEKGIRPLAMPMAVYTEMPAGETMRFRAGVLVGADDARSATQAGEGEIKAGVIPAGDALTTTHTGPYDTLNETHKAMWDHMKAQGVPDAMPVWEIYVDDPGKTPPAELRTQIYKAVGG